MTPLWVSVAALQKYEKRKRMSGNYTEADDYESYDDSIKSLRHK
jgi:hypothetical protein